MLIRSVVLTGWWYKDLVGKWGVLGGRQIYFGFRTTKPLYRVMQGFWGVSDLHSITFLFLTFLPSTSVRKAFRDRTSENWSWQKGTSAFYCWGSNKRKLFLQIAVKCILNVFPGVTLFWWPHSLEAPPPGDKIPSAGSWWVWVVSEARGGLSPSPPGDRCSPSP